MLKKTFILFMIVLSFNMTAQSPEWAPAGLPLYGGQVRCIYNDTLENVMYVTGEIIVAPGNSSSFYICKYNGAMWDTIGGFNQQILSLANYNGELIASGFFNEINGVPIFSIARYDGTNWYPFGNFEEGVSRIKVVNNELYAMGAFISVDGVPITGIAKWNGTAWSDVHGFSTDPGGGFVFDIEIYNGTTYVCGNFESTPLGIINIAAFKAGTWQNVGEGITGGWTSLVEMANYKNELYVSGSIIKPDGNAGHMIQKWNDTTWSEVGNGVLDMSGGYGFCTIYDMLVHDNELYITGGFGYAGNVPATQLAKWDGLKWCAMATKDIFDITMNGGMAIGFYNDTLYLGYGNDTINGVFTNRLMKYLAGNYADTCSIDFTGVDQLSIKNEIVLYPNPVSTQLTMDFEIMDNQNNSFEIKNLLGQTVKSISNNLISKGKNQILIDVNDLSSGLYILQFQNGNKFFNTKFIKQ